MDQRESSCSNVSSVGGRVFLSIHVCPSVRGSHEQRPGGECRCGHVQGRVSGWFARVSRAVSRKPGPEGGGPAVRGRVLGAWGGMEVRMAVYKRCSSPPSRTRSDCVSCSGEVRADHVTWCGLWRGSGGGEQPLLGGSAQDRCVLPPRSPFPPAPGPQHSRCWLLRPPGTLSSKKKWVNKYGQDRALVFSARRAVCYCSRPWLS